MLVNTTKLKHFMIELLPKEKKKLALIAVCNKLLKQAFSIVKNGIPFNREYKSTLVIN